ncbi:MAG: hypothetical protein PHF12_02355 [Candidatus Omnitrophica bacterium]|nr:hypothetical protein [Candidatus Omnitrophota bacterium]
MTRRWLDPSLFNDEKLAKATPIERLLFVAVVANQDDDGRLLGHPGYLRSIAFPYDDFTIEQVKQMRDHLAEINANFIVYKVGSDEYIQLKRHARYQRPRYYHPSKYPVPAGWPFEDEGANSSSEAAAGSSESDHEETAQQPLEQETGNHTATTQSPQGNQKATAQHTEDRVRVGLGGAGLDQDLDLDKGKAKGIPAVSPAQTAAGKSDSEKPHQTEKSHSEKLPQDKATKIKPRQRETGVFLDLVESHIGVRLVQRNKLQGIIRPLLVKVSEATPEKLLECFKWLKNNDTYYRSRDSPAVIMALPAKYPEWAAGKLSAFGGKEVQHDRAGERGQNTQPDRKPYEWQETADQPDDTS